MNMALTVQSHKYQRPVKNLPLIFANQTFLGHQDLEWFGADYSSMNIVATYNFIYNATFMVEKRYMLCALPRKSCKHGRKQESDISSDYS